MENRIFEGKNLAEALADAADRLGIAEPELDYEIVEQGRRGLFGIGAKNVSIRVMPPIGAERPRRGGRRDAAATPAPAAAAAANGEGEGEGRKRRRRRGGRRSNRRERDEGRDDAPREQSRQPREAAPPAPQEAVDQVQATVVQMFGLAGLDLEVKASPAEGGTELQFDGADKEFLNDAASETVGAWQFLLNCMSRRTWPEAGRIQVYCDGQDQTRDEDLFSLARETAEKVLRSGQPCQLRPMNSYERRLVHLTVRKISGVDSRSEGDGAVKSVRVFKRRRRRRRGPRPNRSE